MTNSGPAAAAAASATEPDPPRPVLLSVNVGMPKDVPWQGKTVYTGVWKYPVAGPRLVRRLNIDGDGQGDPAGHGGEQRAVLVYQLDSYRHWQQHFGRDDLSYGQFGENLTVDGMADGEVCIGDRYRIGDAEFEVTQPRVTCYRVGMRMGEPELPALLVSHHRPGFYMRVISEGHIRAGDSIVKTRTGPGALSVADTDALLYLPGRDRDKLRTALRIPALSPGWQGSFRDLLATAERDSAVVGPSPAAGPAWPAFRELRVAEVVRESANVSSIYLAAADGTALPAARAGQYLTLRIAGAGEPAPVRSYSLSLTPAAGTYRISVKQEPHGIASRFLNQDLRPGAVLDVAAPRGDFVLDDGSGPVLLISAGIGATPVLCMLHQLAEQRSERDIWWLHGARGPHEHPFAAEAHTLLASLPRTREHVFYSAATPPERHRVHAAAGRITKEALRWTRPSSQRERVYLRTGLVHGRGARRAYRSGPRPGSHPHRTLRGTAVRQSRAHRPACGPGSATPASRPCCPATSRTTRPRWNHQPTARSSSAAPSPAPTSSWICRGNRRDHRRIRR